MPRLLDLFCCAGGAAVGYHRAGFEVVGVDIEPQPDFPFEFVQADALDMAGSRSWLYDMGFDAIHASPPCQAHSRLGAQWGDRGHVDLVPQTRAALQASGLPWIIENVEGAPLIDPIRMCGSSFGLDVRRHRLFESSEPLVAPPCVHQWQVPRFPIPDKRRSGMTSVVPVTGHLNYPGDLELRREAMGIDWMPNSKITQAIPPAYTEFLGRQLRRFVELRQTGQVAA
jgi:DNA (cytosine-5)-methyltransferase 1